MSMSDPIADLLTRIRNVNKAKLPHLDMPSSKIKVEIVDILKQQGFIKDYEVKKINDVQKLLHIELKYSLGGKSAILELKRISKPSRRVYVKSKDIKPVLNGMGVAILSTSKGVMTDKEARSQKLGGEILCNIW